MAGPRTEVHLRQLEELIRGCDLTTLMAAIGRKDVPSDEEHELYLDALAAGGRVTADDILDEGVFVVLALVQDIAAEGGRHLRVVEDDH
jgi:hypothetical protein